MKAKQTNDFLIKLGNRIFNLRKERKLSQSDVAALMDIDKPNYRKIEKAKKNIAISTLLKLCEAFNVSMKELVDIDN